MFEGLYRFERKLSRSYFLRPRLVTGAARGIRSQFSLMFSVSQSFCWKHPEKERNILKAVKKDKMRQMKEKFELRRFFALDNFRST